MKKYIYLFAIIIASSSCNKISYKNNFVQVNVMNDGNAFWQYEDFNSKKTISIEYPSFEIDGKTIIAKTSSINLQSETRDRLQQSTTIKLTGTLKADSTIHLNLTFMLYENSPVVRFRYSLSSSTPHYLTKVNGSDQLTYFTINTNNEYQIIEHRLSTFNEISHSYNLQDLPLTNSEISNGVDRMGPIISASNKTHTFLMAYEHGSTFPSIFLNYSFAADHSIRLKATKGNYIDKQALHIGEGFQTLWFQIASCKGTTNDLSKKYRTFILNDFCLGKESRIPYIYYNTWGFQERDKWYNKNKYLTSINLKDIKKQIRRSHQLGVEVFVIDAGWFQKTGDWQIDTIKFPDKLKEVKALLDSCNMKMGLWFSPNEVAMSSAAMQKHQKEIMKKNGKIHGPFEVWETEKSYKICLVSSYWETFADNLIRLHRETGVTYFKWDAINQTGCNEPGHYHGTIDNTAEDRAASYSFLLPEYMNKVVKKLLLTCPKAIVDFDVTEKGRSFGLSFLEVGKYFLMNNGPYYDNLDISIPMEQWSNIFVNPGPARPWIMRMPLTFDTWIPMVTMLTHYQADDPISSQRINFASMILGQNGWWGDINSISDSGVSNIAEMMKHYKNVRNDITKAQIKITGTPGNSPEIYEKIYDGRGVLVIISNTKGHYTYITNTKVKKIEYQSDFIKTKIDDNGFVRIDIDFHKPDAAIIFF